MGQQVKNLLRAQSKYGLMGSSAKTKKKFSTGHRSSFLIKLSFRIGHPPPIYQMQCICVGEGSRVPNLQTEFNYLDLFKSYGIFSDFVVPMVPALSPSSPRHPQSPQKVSMWSPSSPSSLLSPLSLTMLSPPMLSPPMLSPSSPLSPHHPCHPHIVPTSSRRSQNHS